MKKNDQKAKPKKETPTKFTAEQFQCTLGTDDGSSTSSKDSKLENLARVIVSRFDNQKSRTSRKAVSRMVLLAEAIIEELQCLSQTHADNVREVAKYRITWPVLTGNHTAIHRSNATWTASIGLNASGFTEKLLNNIPFDHTPVRIQTLRLLKLVAKLRSCAIVSEVVYESIEQMQEEHVERLRQCIRQMAIADILDHVTLTWPLVFQIAQLPDLKFDPSVIRLWEGAVQELLVLSTKGRPESIPALYPLGEPRRFHPLKKADIISLGLVAGSDDSDFPLETQNSNIRSEIFSKIREEISKVARAVTRMRAGSK